MPPLAETEILFPKQILAKGGEVEITGNAFTVTEIVDVLVHPFPSVPVIV
jgi:hypothetical protein